MYANGTIAVLKKMEQAHKFANRLGSTILRLWIRDVRFVACTALGRSCQIGLEELQHCLRQYRMPLAPSSVPDIRILIIDDASLVNHFVDILADDPRGYYRNTARGHEEEICEYTLQPRSSGR
jgi:hypothetical protein